MRRRTGMDKEAYCEQMESNLRELADRLDRLAFPPASTHEVSLMQEEAKSAVEELKTRIAEALADVRALQTSTDPSWEQAKQELDRRWQKISEQKSQFV
jgi:hypothetical protein